RLLQQTSTCHIVLNTHGCPGKSDLADKFVKQLVDELSHNRIAVTQISALMCDGMSRLGVTSMFMKRPTASSMSSLRSKLQDMHTAIPQYFNIVGFNKAYDPQIDIEEVQKVLKGEGDVSL